MGNAYGWSPTATPVSDSARREVANDVASVGRTWVAAAYDDLRRAGPDRAEQVRRVLESYVIPWFGPQTNAVGEISYFMVHEWLLTLVGRRRTEPDDRPMVAAVVCGETLKPAGPARVATCAVARWTMGGRRESDS